MQKAGPLNGSERQNELNEDQREFFEERSAILEFCAGLSRSEAEAAALAMLDEAQKGAC